VVPEDLHVRIELLERAVEPFGAAQHAVLPRHEARVGRALGRNQRGGEVAGMDVLGERARHVASDRFLEGVEGVGHGESGENIILRG
jgi:hypothetical protein